MPADVSSDSFESRRRISSSWTWFYKRAFPFLWYGILSTAATVAIPTDVAQKEPPFGLLQIALMAGLGDLIMRFFLFGLMDEVSIDGDDLVVRNVGEEDRIPIVNVVNLDDTRFVNPESITLTLRTPCRFGAKLVFRLPIDFGPSASILLRRNSFAALADHGDPRFGVRRD